MMCEGFFRASFARAAPDVWCVLMIQGPCLASVQKGEEDHGPEDHNFISYGETIIAEGPAQTDRWVF